MGEFLQMVYRERERILRYIPGGYITCEETISRDTVTTISISTALSTELKLRLASSDLSGYTHDGDLLQVTVL